MKYLIRSVKRAAEAVGIWTEDNWNVKRMNWLYAMDLGGSISKEMRGLIHWVGNMLSGIYIQEWGCIIGELNEEQEQAWQARKKKR